MDSSAPAEARDGGGLYAFYRAMNSRERSAFWASSAGWGLDGLDYTIYPLIIGTIMAAWHVSAGQAGLATTVTLWLSAIGGWGAGYCSDRFGRVRTLQITILWFGVCTLLCGLAQNFPQLLIARGLLGLGFGGEWAAGAALMGETIRAKYRGRALGSVQSAWAIGWGIAVILQAVAYSWLAPAMAWRAMFLFGAIPCVLLFFYIQKTVKEPDLAVAMRARADHVLPPIWDIFAPSVIKRTLLASIAISGAQGGYYAFNTWLPTYLKTERGLSVVGSTGYLGIQITGSFIGYLVGAWLSDKIGRRMVFLVFSAGTILMVLAYTQLPVGPTTLMLLGFPLGFCSSGYFSAVGAFLTELFPTRVRGSAQGFCYNFGRGFGALFPLAVGFLVDKGTPLGNAIAIFAVIAYLMFFAAAFALPETKGAELHAD